MKKIVITLIGIILLSVLIVNVNAVELSQQNHAIIDTGENVPFSFSSWFSNIFNFNQFSVVGKANRYGSQQCSVTENKEWTINGGQRLTIPDTVIEDYCSSDSYDGIFDVFVNDYSPYIEFNYDRMNDYIGTSPIGSSQSGAFDFICSSSRTKCILQLYCCKQYIPWEQSYCESGTTYKEVQCSSWINGGYKCSWAGETEANIPWAFSTFSYCESGSGTIDCYYYSGSGSTCTKYVSPDATCSGQYMSHQLYDSKATCENNIGPCPGQVQCSDGTCKNSASECSVSTSTCENAGGTCFDGSFITGKCPTDKPNWLESADDCARFLSNRFYCCKADGTVTCNNNGVCDSGETNSNCPNDCGSSGKTKVDPATWMTYYSTSDVDMLTYMCQSDTDCNSLEGSTVKCLKNNDVSKRLTAGYRQWCKDNTNFLSAFPLLNLVFGVSQWFIVDACKLTSTIISSFNNDAGMCIASSNGSFGKVWDSILKTVGGFGLPAQYVMIATIVLLFGVVLIVVNLLPKK